MRPPGRDAEVGGDSSESWCQARPSLDEPGAYSLFTPPRSASSCIDSEASSSASAINRRRPRVANSSDCSKRERVQESEEQDAFLAASLTAAYQGAGGSAEDPLLTYVAVSPIGVRSIAVDETSDAALEAATRSLFLPGWTLNTLPDEAWLRRGDEHLQFGRDGIVRVTYFSNEKDGASIRIGRSMRRTLRHRRSQPFWSHSRLPKRIRERLPRRTQPLQASADGTGSPSSFRRVDRSPLQSRLVRSALRPVVPICVDGAGSSAHRICRPWRSSWCGTSPGFTVCVAPIAGRSASLISDPATTTASRTGRHSCPCDRARPVCSGPPPHSGNRVRPVRTRPGCPRASQERDVRLPTVDQLAAPVVARIRLDFSE